MPAVRYLDLIVLALALPIFLVAGWPMLGYAAGAVAWLRAARDPGTGPNARPLEAQRDGTSSRSPDLTGSMIGRGWLVALTIFGAGLIVDDDAGLSAAVLVVVLFTAYFTVT